MAFPFVKGLKKEEALQKKDFGDFENLIAKFTVVNTERISRQWFYDLKVGRKINSDYQPDAWTNFLKDGILMGIGLHQSNLSITEVIKVKNHTTNTMVPVRLTQRNYRKKLLKIHNQCQLCNIQNKRLLIASHIIPWRIANDYEKDDVHNGLLLCANHDRLFDTGLISFNDNGNIMISKDLKEGEYKELNISSANKIKLTEKNKYYLKYHRNHIFLRI